MSDLSKQKEKTLWPLLSAIQFGWLLGFSVGYRVEWMLFYKDQKHAKIVTVVQKFFGGKMRWNANSVN